MNIAITVWGNSISPVFDVAGTLLIGRIENRKLIKKDWTSFTPGKVDDLLQVLKKMDVHVLVCGAISTEPAEQIIAGEVKLISFVSGNAHELLEDFTKNQSVQDTFLMPGCSALTSQRTRL